MQITPSPALEHPPAKAASNAVLVALVEDDPGMRQRLSELITAESGLALAFAAGTAAALSAWLPSADVDVLLVDLGLPDGSGIDLIRQCRALRPACEILVITIYADQGSMRAALAAGANGYLLKDGSALDLATAVRNLLAGGSPMSPLIARQLLADWRSGAEPAPQASTEALPTHPLRHRPASLSAREHQVLDLIARGYTYGEIARRLALSVSTVQSHVRSIYSKMEVHNKSEAVYEARQLGWLR